MAGKDIIMLKHVGKVKTRRDCEGMVGGRKGRDKGVGVVARGQTEVHFTEEDEIHLSQQVLFLPSAPFRPF